MINKKIKLYELFSGLGATRYAFKNASEDNIKVAGACDFYFYAILAYGRLHFKGKKMTWLHKERDFLIDYLFKKKVSIDGKKYATKKQLSFINTYILKECYNYIKKLNITLDIRDLKTVDADILTYSFPCQDLSSINVYNKNKDNALSEDSQTQSSLLWQVLRILRNTPKGNLPKVLLMENVVGVFKEKNKPQFDKFCDNLSDLGYINIPFITNAKDLGCAQKRKRAFMISYLKNDNIDIDCILNKFNNLDDLIKKDCEFFYPKENIHDIVYHSFETLENRFTLNNTRSVQKIKKLNPCIMNKNGEVLVKNIRTITTVQYRHPNAGWVELPFEQEDIGDTKVNMRFLTPRECLKLFGFTDEDFATINASSKFNIAIPDKHLYRLAGNTIVLRVLDFIYRHFIKDFIKPTTISC